MSTKATAYYAARNTGGNGKYHLDPTCRALGRARKVHDGSLASVARTNECCGICGPTLPDDHSAERLERYLQRHQHVAVRFDDGRGSYWVTWSDDVDWLLTVRKNRGETARSPSELTHEQFSAAIGPDGPVAAEVVAETPFAETD